MLRAYEIHVGECLRRCVAWLLMSVGACAGVSFAGLPIHGQERTEAPTSQSQSQPVPARRAGDKGAPNSPEGAGELERAQERWRQMTPRQRDELRRRFEHFRGLDEAERARLRGRFERLGDVKRRAVEALPEAARRELEALAPPQRGEVLREVAAERMLEHVHDVVALMPEHLRQEFAAASEQRRAELVREFGRMLHERARQELFRLGRELDLPRERVEALERLEPRELGREVLELRRQSVERMVAERGLPPFVSAEQWAEIRNLRGPEFMRRWSALHDHRGPPDAPRDGLVDGQPDGPWGEPGGVHPGGPFGGRRGPPHGGDRRRPGPPELDSDPASRPDGPRGERASSDPQQRRGRDHSARGRRLRELRDQVRPEPSWFVELSKLDPDERRRVIGERVRDRALKLLEGAPELIDAAQLERLRSATGREFHELLREHFPDVGEPGFLREARGRGVPPPWGDPPRPTGPGAGGPGRPAGPRPPGARGG